MEAQWSIEELEAALERNPAQGPNTLVPEWVDAGLDPAQSVILYFHLDSAGQGDNGEYTYAFDRAKSLDANFRALWETVATFSQLDARGESNAAIG